jgi:hypothetical protein
MNDEKLAGATKNRTRKSIFVQEEQNSSKMAEKYEIYKSVLTLFNSFILHQET